MLNTRIEADHKAPALGAAGIFIAAPIETVWGVLSGLDRWPEWNRNVAWIRVDGPVRPGTRFVWKAGWSRIASRLEDVAPPNRIAWSGRMPGIRAIHVWELRGEDGGTRVRTEESFEGLVARLFRGYARKVLAKALDQGLSSLKSEAESRAGRS